MRSSSDSQMHNIAKVGFEKVGMQYERGRPRYAAEVLAHYFDEVIGPDLAPNDTIVEIAAGTGILTESLASYFPETNIIAVEPTPSFRDIMRAKFEANERITVRDGLASDLSSIPPHSVSAVFGAQCFHWFCDLEALREFERILKLKKDGAAHLFLIWNVANYNHNAFLRQLRDDVVHEHHGDVGIQHRKFEPLRDKIQGMFSAEFLRRNGLSLKPTAFDIREDSHRQVGGAQMSKDRVLSNSVFGALSDAERESVERNIEHIIEAHYGSLEVELFIPYSTYCIHTCIGE